MSTNYIFIFYIKHISLEYTRNIDENVSEPQENVEEMFITVSNKNYIVYPFMILLNQFTVINYYVLYYFFLWICVSIIEKY